MMALWNDELVKNHHDWLIVPHFGEKLFNQPLLQAHFLITAVIGHMVEHTGFALLLYACEEILFEKCLEEGWWDREKHLDDKALD